MSHYLLPPRACIVKKLELAAEPGLEQVLCCGHAKKPFNYCAKSSSSFQFAMEIFIFVCHCKEKSLFFYAPFHPHICSSHRQPLAAEEMAQTQTDTHVVSRLGRKRRVWPVGPQSSMVQQQALTAEIIYVQMNQTHDVTGQKLSHHPTT